MTEREASESGNEASLAPETPQTGARRTWGRRGFITALGAAFGAAGVRPAIDTHARHGSDLASTLVFIVDDFDEADGDDRAWQRAIDAARVARADAKVVLGTRQEYRFARQVSIGAVDGLVIAGLGSSATTIRGAGQENFDAAFAVPPGTAGRVRDLEFRDLGFDGGISQTEPVNETEGDAGSLTRSERDFDRGAFVTAILVYGDRARQAGTHATLATVENVTVTDVKIRGTSGLPLLISGVGGNVTVQHSHFAWCMDVGFLFCESVSFSDNVVRWSADNGVSISRGTRNVRCIGNDIYGSFSNGIWLGGFGQTGDGDLILAGGPGPDGALVVSNTVGLSGSNGIWLGGAPRQVTVIGNRVTEVVRRTDPTEEGGAPADEIHTHGNGVFIDGFRPSDGGSPVVARDITVTGNTFTDCANGGILIQSGAAGVQIIGNTILRPGRERTPNGGFVTGEEGRANFGVSVPGRDRPTTGGDVARVFVQGNVIVDDRAPSREVGGGLVPILEHAVYINPTARDCVVAENLVYGSRLPLRTDSTVRMPAGTSDGRPAPEEQGAGAMYFDTATNRVLVSDGARWMAWDTRPA